MKYTSLQFLGPVLCASFVLVACASSDDSEPDPTTDVDSGMRSLVEDSGSTLSDTYVPITVEDTGTSVQDSSVTAKDTGTTTTTGCTGHCTQNSDCAAICMPPTGDVACCDTATSMCFVASGECTTTTSSGGEDASAPY